MNYISKKAGGDWEPLYENTILNVSLKINCKTKDGRFNIITVEDDDDSGYTLFLSMTEGREKARKIYNKLINSEYISKTLCESLGLENWNG